jgi:hypothetical protein
MKGRRRNFFSILKTYVYSYQFSLCIWLWGLNPLKFSGNKSTTSLNNQKLCRLHLCIFYDSYNKHWLPPSLYSK